MTFTKKEYFKHEETEEEYDHKRKGNNECVMSRKGKKTDRSKTVKWSD
jgi:hypothetical protein